MKKAIKQLLFSMFVACLSLASYAQQRTITGTVMNDQGASLTGVSYLLKGTTVGGITDDEGHFKVSVTNKTVMVFSAVGYKEQEVPVGSHTTLNVVLQKVESQLDEVVVTALGIKREKRSLGYATSTVKSEDLMKAGATPNPFLAVYGKAAGVGINIGSGGPGGGINIRIRGAAGLESNTNTRPLFVVDGVPIYDEKTSMESRGYDPINSFDYGSGINDINSEDIESIEILKGAKATVLYGSRALNGVVLITTKSGNKTRGLGIQLSQQFTFDKPFSYINFQNEYGTGPSPYLLSTDSVTLKGQLVRKMSNSRYSFGPKFDGAPVMFYDSTMTTYRAYPNNFIDFFRTAPSTRTNIAVSGGGDLGSIRASYSHNNLEDILPGFNSKENKFSFNGNFKVSPFAQFEFINNLYSINTVNRRPNLFRMVSDGLNRDADYNWIKGFYHDADGYRKNLGELGLPAWANNLAEIMWEQNDNMDQDKKMHLISSIKSTLNFTKKISLITQAALDYVNLDYITENKITRLAPARIGGKYSWRKRNITTQSYQSLLKYDTQFGKDLDFFIFGGAAYQKTDENNMYVSTGDMGLLYPNWYSINNENIQYWPTAGAKDKIRGLNRGSDVLYSVLGSGTLSYKNTYYLEFQARNDWTSTLQAPNNSYFYPGVSLTWNFSNEYKLPKMQYGKLRFAWADVGGGPTTATGDRYFANDIFSVSQLPYPNSPTVVGLPSPPSLFLEQIKPFRKREFEVGFDTRWFERSRLEVDFSFYTNNVYNDIVALDITPATGYRYAKINTGNTKHWGYELFVKGSPVATDKYRWELTFTGANQFSKVVKLYPGLTSKNVAGLSGGFQVWAEEGVPIGQIRAYDYKKDPSGNRIVKDGLFVLADKVTNIGENVNPKLFGGFMSDFYFKGFNFHIGLDYKFGGTIFSNSNNYLIGMGITKESLPYRDESKGGLAYYIDKTTGKTVKWEHNQPAPAQAKDGRVYHDGLILDGVVDNNGQFTKNEVVISSITYYQSYINDMGTKFPMDRLFRNDYIKMRELALEYTLPKTLSNKLHLQKVSINAAARNLFYLYKTLPNLDAESALGAQGYIEYSFYPSVRSYSLGFNVSF